MKSLKINGVEYEVVKEFDSAYCIAKYGVECFDLIEEKYSVIKFGQKVFDIKILKSGSVIFLSDNSKNYKFIKICIYFGLPSDEEIEEINKLKNISDKALDDINTMLTSISPLSLY